MSFLVFVFENFIYECMVFILFLLLKEIKKKKMKLKVEVVNLKFIFFLNIFWVYVE